MTKIKNTKKGMAKKTLSMSLVVAMLATSNVPVWAAEFSDSTDAVVTSDAEGFSDVPSVEDEIADNAQGAQPQITTATTFKISEVRKSGINLTTNWKKDAGTAVKIELKKDDVLIASKDNFNNNEEIKLSVAKKSFSKVKIGDTYTCELTIGDGPAPTVSQNIIITGNTHQEYVKEQFAATKQWGTTLNDTLAKQMITDSDATTKLELLGGLKASDISNVEWYDNSNNKQIPDYVTKDSDISKTYTAKMNLNIGGLGVAEVVLGTVTIKAKAASGTITNVTWDSGTVDGSGNVIFTYDGKTHYPRLTQFVYDGKIIKATDPGVSIAYTPISEAQATDANEDVNNPASSGVNYIDTITTPDGIITYNKKLIINKIDLTTAGTLNVGKGFEYDPNNSYAASKTLLEDAGLSVTASGKTLEYDASNNKDYKVLSLIATDNKVGTDKMTVTVEGTKNYKGTIVATAPINAYKLKDEDVALGYDSVSFDGDEKTPTVTVKYKNSGSSLTENTDYTVSYKNNTNVGTATVTVTGKGNYTGTVEKTFEITTGDFSELAPLIKASFTAEKCVYTGKPIDLVKDNYKQYKYRKGTDFTVSYEPQNTNVGMVNVKITGQGNYKGNTGNTSFEITARPITDNDVKVNVQGLTYSTDMTDKQITDATTITYNGMTLVENTDYTISVLSKNGKTVILSIKGIGNYSGVRTEVVNVTAKDINTVTLPKIEAQKYSGDEFVVDNNQLKTNSTKVADFEIKDGNYTLEENKDYKISSYENNKSVGTAKINIVGIGAYSGNVTVSFPIVAKELNGTIMYRTTTGTTALLPDKEYNYKDATSSKGYTFEFAPSTSLVNEKLSVVDESGAVVDPAKYTVSYKDNKAAGTATITVEGKGGYKLNAVNTFKIVPAKLSDKVTPTGEIVAGANTIVKTGKTYNYTGEAIEAELSFEAKDGEYKLVKDVDYKIEYSDNVNAGTNTAKVKLVGLGNYAGTLTTDAEKNKVSTTFSIAKTLIRATDISATDTAYAGGITVTPNITINNQYSNKALVAGTDYTVEVTKGGVNVGQAEAKIKLTSAAAKNYDLVGTGKTEYNVNFNVTALDLSKATVSPIADQTVTGEQIKPAVTVMNGSVKLTEGKDYEVSYGENKEVGEGTVTIKALSSNKNYTGSQTVKFNIVEKAAEVGQAMISDVIVKGNTVTPVLSGEVDGAVGYDYVIATEEDYKNGRVDISKNILKTNTDFHYVQKGTYYAYCHAWKRGADGKKVFGEWSNIYEFTVKATTPSKPSIKSVKVKGHTVTVTFTASENAKGYDVVLGEAVKKVNGENRPVEYGKLVVKNIEDGVYTATFHNVPDGKYYAGVHSYNKTSNDGKKVFSKWGYRKSAISVGKAK